MAESEVRLPAEWEPQSAVMLTWPHAHGDWGTNLTAAERVFVDIARAVTAHEALLVGCGDAPHLEHVRSRLVEAGVDLGRVRLSLAPSNDAWARDHGPLTVLDDGRARLLDFRFNGWGGKYAATLDDGITLTHHGHGVFGGTPLSRAPLVLEGGAVETDGRGTLLATRSAMLSASRNPGLSQAALESRLHQWLGVERFLWLEHGALEGDDTDGHIDTLARFCDPETIAYVRCDDPADPHYGPLQAMEEELRAFRTGAGAPYRLVALPWPAAKYDENGQRLPATYANFLIIDGAVLAPTYADPADQEALHTLQRCFPGRRIVGIDCGPLIRQHGSLHCVTMQLPAGVLALAADSASA